MQTSKNQVNKHNDSEKENILFRAEFDPKLKFYWFLTTLIAMVVTVVGIPLVPFWLLGLGMWWCRKRFDHLQCFVQGRSLVVRNGIMFKVERTIPLDKIQDLTLREGVIQKFFGLCSLQIETAGQSTTPGSSDANLVGIVDARGFRDKVLQHRDDLAEGLTGPALPTTHSDPAAVEGLLTEIRDSLKRIEDRFSS